jgi:ectoine hydroxylase-related dioxygenase (phytanoyl-CoA dioxygenase family)
VWKDAIQEQGYYIFPPLFSIEELELLGNALSDAGVKRSRAGVRHALQLEAVANVAEDQRLLGIAQAALGPAAIPFHATLFDKTPDANWLVVWHQDTALPLLTPIKKQGWGPWSVKEGINYAHAPAKALSRVLALRLHLDDSTLANGPLRVLPCTHQEGVLTDDAIHELSQRIAPVDCEASRGGIVAMRPLTIHSSSKSLSDAPRRVLHFEYAVSLDIEEGIKLAVA